MVDLSSLDATATGFVSRMHTYIKNIETAHLGKIYTTALNGLHYYGVECAAKPILRKAPDWVSQNRVVSAIQSHQGISIVVAGVATVALLIYLWVMAHPSKAAAQANKLPEAGPKSDADAEPEDLSGQEESDTFPASGRLLERTTSAVALERSERLRPRSSSLDSSAATATVWASLNLNKRELEARAEQSAAGSLLRENPPSDDPLRAGDGGDNSREAGDAPGHEDQKDDSGTTAPIQAQPSAAHTAKSRTPSPVRHTAGQPHAVAAPAAERKGDTSADLSEDRKAEGSSTTPNGRATPPLHPFSEADVGDWGMGGASPSPAAVASSNRPLPPASLVSTNADAGLEMLPNSQEMEETEGLLDGLIKDLSQNDSGSNKAVAATLAPSAGVVQDTTLANLLLAHPTPATVPTHPRIFTSVSQLREVGAPADERDAAAAPSLPVAAEAATPSRRSGTSTPPLMTAEGPAAVPSTLPPAQQVNAGANGLGGATQSWESDSGDGSSSDSAFSPLAGQKNSHEDGDGEATTPTSFIAAAKRGNGAIPSPAEQGPIVPTNGQAAKTPNKGQQVNNSQRRGNRATPPAAKQGPTNPDNVQGAKTPKKGGGGRRGRWKNNGK